MSLGKKPFKNIVEKEKLRVQAILSFPTMFSTLSDRNYHLSGFSPEIFEGKVAFSGVVKLGSITNVTQSAT